jgi:hypothetical protein
MLRFYKPRLQGSRARLFALLCIALVIIGGTIQIAHTHSFDHLAHPECSLCVTAHVGISPAALIVLPAPGDYAARIEVEPRADGPRSFFTLPLYIRPPPVVPAFI